MKGRIASLVMFPVLLVGCSKQEPQSANADTTGAPADGARPAQPAVEDFAAVFARMQEDPAFVRSRLSREFVLTDHYSDLSGSPISIARTVTCDLAALQASDWTPIAARSALAKSPQYRYQAPRDEADGAKRVILTWGPHIDMELRFVPLEGRWQLASVENSNDEIDASAPLPAPEPRCMGHRPR